MCAGIKGIWSLRASSSDEHDRYLVLTFVGETRVLAISAEDELDEAEIPGFESNAQVGLMQSMACVLLELLGPLLSLRHDNCLERCAEVFRFQLQCAEGS